MEETKITTIEGGQIDQEALDAMSAKLVDMCITDEKQMHRTELNFSDKDKLWLPLKDTFKF